MQSDQIFVSALAFERCQALRRNKRARDLLGRERVSLGQQMWVLLLRDLRWDLTRRR
ncbi:MAG: hypothetical protein DHS20C16_22280 [Phycisphaerae bacterium]|nr:MAG: hypothetical protein DHS20C16_22280 [Phycisphaerae bacterium]